MAGPERFFQFVAERHQIPAVSGILIATGCSSRPPHPFAVSSVMSIRSSADLLSPALTPVWLLQERRSFLLRIGHAIQKLVVERPGRRLRPIGRAYFSKDRLHMSFNSGLGDMEESRNMLVGISLHNSFKDC